VGVIAQNDSGAFATRELLFRELSSGSDRLHGKRVVFWEFAARELSVGDFKALPWTRPARPRLSVALRGTSCESAPGSRIHVRISAIDLAAAGIGRNRGRRDHLRSSNQRCNSRFGVNLG
jgi:hypothetical protein